MVTMLEESEALNWLKTFCTSGHGDTKELQGKTSHTVQKHTMTIDGTIEAMLNERWRKGER